MRASLTLTDAVEAMVAQKRTVGYKYEAEEAILYRFVAFTRSHFPGLETITEVSANAWIEAAQKRAVTPSTLHCVFRKNRTAISVNRGHLLH